MLTLAGALTLSSPAAAVQAAGVPALTSTAETALQPKLTGFVTENGNTYYYNSAGQKVTGFITVGSKRYYMAPAMKKNTMFTVNNKLYYAARDGVIPVNKWLFDNNYFAGANGEIYVGLRTIGSKKYYFTSTGKKVKNTIKTISKDTYYFGTDGAALTKKWAKLNGKFYYFLSSGKMAKNAIVGSYYVNANGVRVTSSGWVTVGGKKYYLGKNGKKTTGMATISGKKYFFAASGAMVTGWVTSGGKKYFFAPDGHGVTGLVSITKNGKKNKYFFYQDGSLAVSTTVVSGTWQYTVNSSGIVTNSVNLSIPTSNVGAKIINYALTFVGNKYVYGGNDPHTGVDCSGFTKYCLAHFGFTNVPRTANDQMHGSGGISIPLSAILPGDCLFFGSGNYASHVVFYMGNDKIVHASNSQPYPKGGIKISTLSTYGQKPLKAMRYWR